MALPCATEEQAEKPNGPSWVGIVLAVLTLGLMVLALTMKNSLVFWLVVEAAIFIPVERVLALSPQKVFRRAWRTDLVHYMVNGTLVSVALAAIVAAFFQAGRWLVPAGLYDFIGSQPEIVQLAEAVVLAEFCYYWAHRATHANRYLWRFHALHHSIEEMDWLAAGRLHPVDQVFTRACTVVPVAVLGFSEKTFGLYLVLTGFQAFFNHSNIRVTFGPLRWLVGTPEYHHWHHANHPEAYNTNFSEQFPFLDAMFGTLHMPTDVRHPTKYGIDKQPPEQYLRGIAWSFTAFKWRKRKKRPVTTPVREQPAPSPSPSASQ